MADLHGHFVWRELMTSDVAAAKAFYGPLLGWTWTEREGGYAQARAGERYVAGLMALPPHVPAPTWLTYLSVADVDAVAAAVAPNGGAVRVPPSDIPGVGRWAAIADPTGAVLLVVATGGNDEPTPDPVPPGFPTWETLETPDAAASTAFATTVLPLTAGRFGDHPVLLAPDGDSVADVEAAPVGRWLVHVRVAGLDAALAQVVALGGRVVRDAVAVPGVGRMATVADPQGAELSLYEVAG